MNPDTSATDPPSAPPREPSRRPGLRWTLALVLAVGLSLVGAAAAVASVAAGAFTSRSYARLGDLSLPQLVVADEIRAAVGEPTEVKVSAVDGRGGDLDVSAVDAPDGLDGSRTGFVWTPGDAGTWSATFAATDRFGRTTTTVVALVSRHEARPDLVVGMGDSVASGHGLQRRDYVTGDPCWRDESEAYPRRVADLLRPTGEVALVACSGAGVSDLIDEKVSGGGLLARGGDAERTQVDWAVRANPGLVTLTIGANDLDFHRPEQLIHGGVVDEDELAGRLDAMGEDLVRVLDRLVDATDARIVVTTYHNPVADEPRGIGGCRDECFHDAAGFVVSGLNSRLEDVVAAAGDRRVVLADVAPVFEGHGAPRPFGGFSLRETGLDLAARLVPVPRIPTSAFCAAGDGDGGGSWINDVDCIHPTGAGADAYAEAVAAAADL